MLAQKGSECRIRPQIIRSVHQTWIQTKHLAELRRVLPQDLYELLADVVRVLVDDDSRLAGWPLSGGLSVSWTRKSPDKAGNEKKEGRAPRGWCVNKGCHVH